MPYYHVTLASTLGRSHNEEIYNCSRELLEERILSPRSKGVPIAVNGKVFPDERIERIRIWETAHAIESLSQFLSSAYISGTAKDVTDDFITGPPGQDSTERQSVQKDLRPPTDTRDVFVIHGRNAPARDAMFAFLRSLSLHPLEWQELVAQTRHGSPYIGDILEVAFSRAHALVVLMTPDDEARLREPLRNGHEPCEAILQGQARPNVLFEAGMAFGRNAARTVLVQLGNLRRFTDVDGRHTIRWDGSPGRRNELAQRLKSAGCPVNTDGNDWLTAGDFSAAIALATAVETREDVAIPEGQDSTIANADTQISSDAAELLTEAADNGNGRIMKVALANGTIIMGGRREFSTMGDRRSEAKWESALGELVDQSLAHFSGGESFDVTHLGFTVADSLRGKN